MTSPATSVSVELVIQHQTAADPVQFALQRSQHRVPSGTTIRQLLARVLERPLGTEGERQDAKAGGIETVGVKTASIAHTPSADADVVTADTPSTAADLGMADTLSAAAGLVTVEIPATAPDATTAEAADATFGETSGAGQPATAAAIIHAINEKQLGLARHGRRAWLDDILADRDRVEILCPILTDAKAARFERVAKARAEKAAKAEQAAKKEKARRAGKRH